MPICDGFEASSTIRKNEPNFNFAPDQSRPVSHVLNHGIPIVAVTANAQERGREKLVEAGIGELLMIPLLAGSLEADLHFRRRMVFKACAFRSSSSDYGRSARP